MLRMVLADAAEVAIIIIATSRIIRRHMLFCIRSFLRLSVSCTPRSSAERYEDSRIQGVDDSISIQIPGVNWFRSGCVERNCNDIQVILVDYTVAVHVPPRRSRYTHRHAHRERTSLHGDSCSNTAATDS